MFLSYLITSDEYHKGKSTRASLNLANNLHNAHRRMQQKRIDFAAFRYANKNILSSQEFGQLIVFICICNQYNTIPLLNLSALKLESLFALYMCGFYVGIHFKENDKILLQNNVSSFIHKSFHILQDLKIRRFYTNPSVMIKEMVDIFMQKLCPQSIQILSFNKDSLQEGIQNLLEVKNKLKMHSDIYNPHAIKKFINIRRLNPPYKHKQNNSSYQEITWIKNNIPIPIFSSAHNIIDLEWMLKMGVDYATISPIFYDKGNKALGIKFLKNIPKNLKKHTIGLGGVRDDSKILMLKKCELAGFASISYFLEK